MSIVDEDMMVLVPPHLYTIFSIKLFHVHHTGPCRQHINSLALDVMGVLIIVDNDGTG